MQAPSLRGLGQVADRASRFGAFDPFLNTARAAGLLKWGPGVGALVHASALRWPKRAAVIDDDGELSYRKLDKQADALAKFLRADGASTVGLLCRNHRGFLVAQIAVERAGRDVVMLSTALPAAQLRTIVDREKLDLLIADDEFAEQLAQAGVASRVIPPDPSRLTIRSRPNLLPPRHRSQIIMLTSGTTGPPKGARRGLQNPRLGDAALLDAMPMRMNDVTLIASPLFHAWGLAQATIALSTGSTVVVQTSFDPARTLQAISKHRVTMLAVVPVMLTRLLDAAPAGLQLKRLRAVVCSGNVLSATLAKQWIDRFGPNLYNIYGSTETAIASVATPADLVDAPGTVGRPPKGVTVTILDDDDVEVAAGELGRVFTANNMQFEGYTDGSNRSRHGNLMATGDLGFLDADGRLFVDGRENDLIVTGGENVFPSRIEEVLEQHRDVKHAAVVGVADDNYGQRVVAFVVTHTGIDIETLEQWGRSNLASFERPREYRLVDVLPMTGTGKVIRHALATLAVTEPI